MRHPMTVLGLMNPTGTPTDMAGILQELEGESWTDLPEAVRELSRRKILDLCDPVHEYHDEHALFVRCSFRVARRQIQKETTPGALHTNEVAGDSYLEAEQKSGCDDRTRKGAFSGGVHRAGKSLRDRHRFPLVPSEEDTPNLRNRRRRLLF